MVERNESRELLLREFDQAWEHYRHTESARTQYLGFFFTVALATAALAASLITSNDSHVPGYDQPVKLVSLAVFLWVAAAVAAVVLTAVQKAGAVLAFYEGLWNSIRESIYGSTAENEELRRRLNIRLDPSLSLRRRLPGMQLGAVTLVASFQIVAFLAEAVLAVHLLNLGAALALVAVPAVAATLITVTFVVLVTPPKTPGLADSARDSPS